MKKVFVVYTDEALYYFDDLQLLAEFLVQINETFEVMEQAPDVVVDTRQMTQAEWDALAEINIDKE